MVFNIEKKFIIITLLSYSLSSSVYAIAAPCWIDHTENYLDGINIYFDKNIPLFGYLNKGTNEKESLRIEDGKIITNAVNVSKDAVIIHSSGSDYLFMKDGYTLYLYTHYEQCFLEVKNEDNAIKIYFKNNNNLK
ncbi:MAG: hypothetical protein V4525_05335 [Pseudomonadota bacterium]